MSLQRRLLLYLLLCAPLVWGVALWISVNRASLEVNELFDSEMIHLARQVQATLYSARHNGAIAPDLPLAGSSGEADLRDLAIAVWDASGRLVLTDREGMHLPRRPQASGFVEMSLGGEAWRVYYLQSIGGEWLVASGQKVHEREELVFNLTSSQILPWLLVLPVLLLAMAWAVRRALAPVHQLTSHVQQRHADDLRPLHRSEAPQELQPLVDAMNGLFGRIEDTLARERRFTADAAHELRTPLAVLRAQWDVLARAGNAEERALAESRLAAGLERMDRLVAQLLTLSRTEAVVAPLQTSDLDWPAIVEQVISDSLDIAERRRVELACQWPAAGQVPWPMAGDAALMTVALRNLVDNAVRYAPAGSAVQLDFGAAHLAVENDGPALTVAEIARLGERFHRPPGQLETGSGLGVSIVQRIAALHGLELHFGPRADGQGVRAELRPAAGR